MSFLPHVRTGVAVTGAARVTWYDSADVDDPRTPVLLLHGTGGTATSHFWALFPMLAERRRVLALDFADPAPGIDPDASWYVAQAGAVLDALSLGRPADVLGYSLGAVTATALASRRPDAVGHLVLVAGWLRTDAHQLLRNDLWWQLREADPAALGAFSVLTAYSPSHLLARTPAELTGLVARAAAGPDRAAAMRANRTVDLTEDAAAVTAPTLVVACTADQMVPPHHARLLFGAINDARYVELQAGHAVVHERPAELFHVVSRFFADPGRTRAGEVLTQETA